MASIKNIITAAFACMTCVSAIAHAETVSFYAGKIIKNCDYEANTKKPLEKSFTASELRTLRIAISVDEAVCQQTHVISPARRQDVPQPMLNNKSHKNHGKL